MSYKKRMSILAVPSKLIFNKRGGSVLSDSKLKKLERESSNEQTPQEERPGDTQDGSPVSDGEL
jgi:hypothetical protein